ncbi:hypothetical protein H5410_038541 [Solanum commersonii]|uniref:Cytochrome P450 n=1 Tax=Solanum commersonii TaxID=4109 RepID=A0A9J5YAZ7_SOLCO|nr:hypothetical protein H5410_038541 [Solanum commersonii]
MEMLSNIIATICVAILLIYTWKVLNWAWFRPKKLEKYFRQNGLKGNPYKLLYGDLNELTKRCPAQLSYTSTNLSIEARLDKKNHLVLLSLLVLNLRSHDFQLLH